MIICQYIHSSGFNPIFSLTSALTELLIEIMKYKYQNCKIRKVFIAIAVGQLITTVLMSPLFITFIREGSLFGTNEFRIVYYARVAKAFVRQAFNVPVYTIIFSIIVKPISRAIDITK